MTWTRLFNSRRLIVSLTWTKLFNFRRLIVSLTWKNYFLEIEFSTSKQTILQVQAFQNPLFFVCITSQPNEHIKESYVNITPCKTFPRQPWKFNFPQNYAKRNLFVPDCIATYLLSSIYLQQYIWGEIKINVILCVQGGRTQWNL